MNDALADGDETDHDVDNKVRVLVGESLAVNAIKLMAGRAFNNCQVVDIEMDFATGRLEVIIKARRHALVVRHGRARDFGALILREFGDVLGASDVAVFSEQA